MIAPEATPINTLTNNAVAVPSAREGSLGERYFVAKTESGVCVVNYEPDDDVYLGGPFITWDGACAFVDAHRRQRLISVLLFSLGGLSLIALGGALLRWLLA